jgi:pyrroloquinoline-quinone synthase
MAVPSGTVSAVEFVRQLKQDIQAFPKIRIKHPFVKAVSNGAATMEQIREWAIQDYQFRAAVPRISMLRYLACTDPEFARRLYGVVEEETEGLATGSAGHCDMFVEFAESIGIARKDLDTATLAPATAAHLYYVELVIHTLPWFIVMSAQIGAEGTFGPAAAALGQGFIKQYGMKPAAVRFFTVHVEADADHGSLAEEIAVRYITSPHLQEQTRTATFRRMELLYDIWDAGLTGRL